MTARALAGRAHAWLYRTTHGRVGGRIAGRSVLILTTTGRRSGRARRTAVQYEVIDGAAVVVAAAGGARSEPAWCLNLRAQPGCRVQIGADEANALARIADGDRPRLWAELCSRNPALPGLERRAGRKIPVVVLTPVAPRGTTDT